MKHVEVVAISAGFDAHENDPMASLGLSTECYRKIGRKIGSLNLPTFATLEGGYDTKDLGRNIHGFLQGLQEKHVRYMRERSPYDKMLTKLVNNPKHAPERLLDS